MRFVLNEAMEQDSPSHCTRSAGGLGALLLAAGLGLGVASLVPTPAAAQFARAPDPEERVLLTVEEALREVFPGHAAVETTAWRPSAERRASMEERLGRRLFEPRYEIMEVRSASGLMGYAVVTDERGKYRPITLMVGVSPDLRVRDTAILVYRESRGGQVQRQRFLRQYRGKDSSDAIRINSDIVNISGATISVRSVNAGVRKILVVVEEWSAAR
ncbi:MAG: FMN-binding protein [Gemmatimonadota bacterium]